MFSAPRDLVTSAQDDENARKRGRMTSEESDGGPTPRVQKKIKRETSTPSAPPATPTVATPKPLTCPLAEATPAPSIKTSLEKLKITMSEATDNEVRRLVEDAIGSLSWECEIITLMHQAIHLYVTRVADKMHDRIINEFCDHESNGKRDKR